MPRPQFAVIIPACDEEECIGRVLDELSRTIDPERFVIAVGVNGSSDRTAEVARARGVLVAETSKRGYGYGCQKAIDLVASTYSSLRAYIFFAGDGASDPQDVRNARWARMSRVTRLCSGRAPASGAIGVR